MTKAAQAASAAIELDPSLADAHVSLGEVRIHQLRWSEAEAAYQRALKLDANSARAHYLYGHYLINVGRPEESVAAFIRARELDPLSVGRCVNLARAYSLVREMGRSEELCKEAVQLEPNHPLAQLCLGTWNVLQGHYAEAIPYSRLLPR